MHAECATIRQKEFSRRSAGKWRTGWTLLAEPTLTSWQLPYPCFIRLWLSFIPDPPSLSPCPIRTCARTLWNSPHGRGYHTKRKERIIVMWCNSKLRSATTDTISFFPSSHLLRLRCLLVCFGAGSMRWWWFCHNPSLALLGLWRLRSPTITVFCCQKTPANLVNCFNQTGCALAFGPNYNEMKR